MFLKLSHHVNNVLYYSSWGLMVEPVVLCAVTHAPTIPSDIAAMFELSTSLVSAAPTSLSVGSSRTSVEQYTP